MKQLDKLLIKLFAGPFLVTFVISVFILIMQFLWLYIDDLLGKGVEFALVLELVFYWSSVILPLALPLTILLSSIMTFGNLGESFELTSVKSAGISLQRFAQPLLILIIAISIGLYFFQNFVAPKFNLNALALLHDIRTKKPAFDLRPNVFFNEMEGYSIKINAKNNKDELFGIMIYDHTDNNGIDKYIYAEKGQMQFDEKLKKLTFDLYNGYRIEEISSLWNSEYENRTATFKEWSLTFDQSQFDMKRIDKEAFENNPMLMNSQELSKYILRCDTNIKRSSEAVLGDVEHQLNFSNSIIQQEANSSEYVPEESIIRDESIRKEVAAKMANRTPLDIEQIENKIDYSAINTDSSSSKLPLESSKYSPFLKKIEKSQLDYIINRSKSKVKSIQSSIELNNSNTNIYERQRVDALIEWNQKIAVSVACVLLFIIGASLGSIIRKGGLGLPIIVAVLFFIFYYLMIAFGEKFAKQEKLTPFQGVWFASMILAPLSIFLFRKAVNDSPLLNKDLYIDLWNRMRSYRFFPKANR